MVEFQVVSHLPSTASNACSAEKGEKRAYEMILRRWFFSLKCGSGKRKNILVSWQGRDEKDGFREGGHEGHGHCAGKLHDSRRTGKGTRLWEEEDHFRKLKLKE